MDVLEGGWRSCVREVSFLVLEWNWNKKGMFFFFFFYVPWMIVRFGCGVREDGLRARTVTE